MGRLIIWMKIKTTESKLLYMKKCVLEVQRGVLKVEYKVKTLFNFVSLVLPSIIFGSLLMLLSSLFYSHPPLF